MGFTGHNGQSFTLYSLLRTIEDMYRLPALGESARRAAEPWDLA
jgi:hypothetical protein